MRNLALGRRTLLRGAGVSVALPVMDAMLNGRGLLHGSALGAALPQRLFVWTFGNGTRMNLWNPKVGDGPLAAAMLPPALAPLMGSAGKVDLLPDLTLVTGLNHKQTVLSGAHDGVFIASGGPNVKNTKLSGFPLPGGPSIDQVASLELSPPTRLRSLVVSNDKDELINWAIISWTKDGQPIQPYRSNTVLFDKLFTGGGVAAAPGVATSAELARQLDKSILDFALDDARSMRAALGTLDRQRLDEHLQAIREVERQISMAPVTGAGCAAPQAMNLADGGSFVERGRIMSRLYVMALACDLSRYGTFNFQNSDGVQRWPGVPESDHGASHTGSEAIVLDITRRKMEEFGYLVRLMKETREGPGTLLDNALVLCSSEIGQGNSHSTTDLPVLIAGRGGGMKSGRHLSRPRANYNDMLCSLLNHTGVPVPKFGVEGTGPLPGL